MTFRVRWLVTVVLALVFAVMTAWAPACGVSQAPEPGNAPETAASRPPPQSAPDAGGPAYKLPPEKLAKAIAISRIRNVMDIVGSLWGLAVLWLLLAMHGAAGLQRWVEGIVRARWVQGLLFFCLLIVILTVANLPLDVFGHIVSRNYGISVQGWGSWFLDELKALAVAVAFGAPVLLFFNWIVRVSPQRYWLWIWVVTLPIMVLVVFGSPLIEPFFNSYEPLSKEHAGLVAKLEQVVRRTGTNIPPERMFLMKASEKTNGLNAYVSGLGATKRIVVWDTTAARIPDDEVIFVFGHESGHYVLNHIPKMLAGLAIGLFFIYWACAALSARLAQRFGAGWQLDGADHPLASSAGFVVLIFAVTLAGFVLEPVANTFSRHFEHEADVYGQEALHGLVPDPQKTAVAGFNALGEAWLEDPDPSPFIEFWEYNHPSVKTRANFAADYDPWKNGGHGKFFDR